MKIIQDKTRFKNLRKISEMKEYFENNEELDLILWRSRDSKVCFEICLFISFLLLILGMYLVVSGKARDLSMIQRIRYVGCLFFIYAMGGFFLWRHDRIVASKDFRIYSQRDLFLYFLMTNGFVTEIRVSGDRRELILYKGQDIIRLSPEDFEIKGDGSIVDTVDLDDDVLYMKG